MAKLLVTRPRHVGDGIRKYRILIDGDQVSSIGPGQTIQIDLPPGSHELTARIAWVGSQRVPIKGGPEATYHLIVGPNKHVLRLMVTAALLLTVLPVGLSLFAPADPQLVTRIIRSGWVSVLIIPVIILPGLLPIAVLAFVRNHMLSFEASPSHDLQGQQVAELTRERPFRVRMTIRGMMIAVAIVAIVFWAGIEGVRRGRGSYFLRKAELHARLEAINREAQQKINQIADGIDQKKGNSVATRAVANKYAQIADYHDAMRRKYQQAASQRWFSVDPDPPLPPPP